MKTYQIICFLVACVSFQNCGFYSFTGADTGTAETFQVNFFQNNAALIEPGLDIDFTNALQDLIQNQTKLSLVNSGGFKLLIVFKTLFIFKTFQVQSLCWLKIRKLFNNI